MNVCETLNGEPAGWMGVARSILGWIEPALNGFSWLTTSPG